MTLGRNTIMSLSRRNAASESAKKAVVRGSWLVKAHHHSEWAVVKYHSGPPFGTAPTSYEPRTTNNKKALAVVPPLLPNLGHLCLACIPSHHQVTRFGISDSHGFARRKAPLLTMHYVYITFQAGRPLGRPLRTTNSFPTSHELRTTKKHWNFPVLFLQESAASYPPRGPPPKYFRRLRA